MRAFVRDGEALAAELEEFEVALLASLCEQLLELLGGDQGPDLRGLDPFQRLAAEHADTVALDVSDPLIKRLFPDAYGDPSADAEYRRLTTDAARNQRVSDARTVLADLAATSEGARPLHVAPKHVDAWLKTVNALRISLAVRLDIVDESSLASLSRLSARDPRTPVIDIYDWLGYVLESLLSAL